MRPMMSGELPGAFDTTMRTGRTGYCPSAAKPLPHVVRATSRLTIARTQILTLQLSVVIGSHSGRQLRVGHCPRFQLIGRTGAIKMLVCVLQRLRSSEHRMVSGREHTRTAFGHVGTRE